MGDNRFGLARENIDRILDTVYWGQATWLIGIGALFALAPERRYGNSWQFVLAVPGGQYILAAVNLTLGGYLVWSMRHRDRAAMARGMRLAGFTHWILALLLFVGAVAGPTGVVGSVYALYVGAHLLLQSALLKTPK